ncbi:MAG: VOC family protein [Cyclobacteriaceae bacterium]|nr:VOC family protein [Cyclobacteriaceae bacterium]
MTHIRAYLTFNGNCREAMTFYKKCFGGELVIQPIRDTPMAYHMPDKMKDCILHSTLTKEKFILMGSDMIGEDGIQKGNTVSLLLDCNTEEELNKYYNNLSAKGIPTHPIETTFWGALFGGLTDQFGNHWLLHFQQKNTNEKD